MSTDHDYVRDLNKFGRERYAQGRADEAELWRSEIQRLWEAVANDDHDCVRDHPSRSHLLADVERCFREHRRLRAEVEQLREMHERDLIQVSDAHEARRKAEHDGVRDHPNQSHLQADVERLQEALREALDMAIYHADNLCDYIDGKVVRDLDESGGGLERARALTERAGP